MLYMFQAVPPPIIRSSKLYTASGICRAFTASYSLREWVGTIFFPFIRMDMYLGVICFSLHILLYQTAAFVLYSPLLMFLYWCVSFACLALINVTFSSKSLTQAVRSRKSSTNTRCCVYSIELLMMGGGTAYNMWRIYNNKYHYVNTGGKNKWYSHETRASKCASLIISYLSINSGTPVHFNPPPPLSHSLSLQRLYSPGWASASFKSFFHPSRFRATVFQFLHLTLATSSSIITP